MNQWFLLVKLKSSLRKFYDRHHDLVDRYGISVTNDHGYVPLVVSISRSFPHSGLITGFVTRLTRRVPLVEQELLTLPEHQIPPQFSLGFVLLDLQFYMYVLLIFVCPFCAFSFGHSVLLYLQTLFACVIIMLLPSTRQSPGASMSLGVGFSNNSYKPISNTAWVCGRFVNYQPQPHVMKFTSCLPMVGDSLLVLRLLPPLKLVGMIQLKYC